MAKKIQVIVDVDSNSVKIASDNTLTLTQQVRLLKQELQKVPEGTAEWTLIQQKYNETKDSLDRVNVKSRELFGTMSALPGPIGNVAGQLDNTIGTLKTFSSLKLSDLKAQFTEAGKDLLTIGKNLLQVTGITRIYTAVNGALATSFTAVGVGELAAAAGARAFALALTATGVGAIIVAVGLLLEKIISLGQAFFSTEKEAAALQATMNKFDKLFDSQRQKQKEIYERGSAQAKAAGATDKQLYDKKIEYINGEIKAYENLEGTLGLQRRAKLLITDDDKERAEINEDFDKKELTRANKLSDLRIEKTKTLTDFIITENKKVADANKILNDKQDEANKKLAADKELNLKAIAKYDEEIRQDNLTAQEKELAQAKIVAALLYEEAIRTGNSTVKLIEAYEAKKLQIKQKYINLELDAQYKLKEDLISDEQKTLEAYQNIETIALDLRYAQGLIKEEEYQVKLYEIKNKYALTDEQKQKAEIDLLDYANKKKQEAVDATERANKAIQQSYLDLESNLATTFTAIAGLFEKGSDAAKTFAVIGVLLNAAAAIGKIKLATSEAIADFGKAAAAGAAAITTGTAMLPLNPVTGGLLIASGTKATLAAGAGLAAAKAASAIQIATVGITSGAQIAAILSAGKGSKSASASAGGTSGGGSAPTPAFNGTVSVPAPVIGASNASSSGNLGQTIMGAVQAGNSTSRPIQTYVVGDQISTQQQLDRRISAAAKLAG